MLFIKNCFIEEKKWKKRSLWQLFFPGECYHIKVWQTFTEMGYWHGWSMNACLAFPLNTHFVHDICILLCKDQVHGIVLFGEGEHAGVLAVLPITRDLRGFLWFLHIQRANGTPTNPPEPLLVILLVLILPNRRQKQSLQCTNSSYGIIAELVVLQFFPKQSHDGKTKATKRTAHEK